MSEFRDPVAGQPVYCRFDEDGKIVAAHLTPEAEGATEIGWQPWLAFQELQPRVRWAGGTGDEARFEKCEPKRVTDPGAFRRDQWARRRRVEILLLSKLTGKTVDEVLDLVAEAAEELAAE